MKTHRDRDRTPRRGEVFGITTTVADYGTMLSAIDAIPAPAHIAYVHFDTLLRCRDDSAFRFLLGHCSLIYPDGIGARHAFRILHGPPVARINATDMNHELLAMSVRRGRKVAVLGGMPAAEVSLRRALLALGFSDDRILVHHGYHDIMDAAILESLRRFKPDVIFLGMGTPKQFEWMHAHRTANFAPLIVATGGFIDFLAGTTRRAPRWMRAAGIEWMHRLLYNPARLWKRYLVGIPRFLWLLLRERLRATPR